MNHKKESKSIVVSDSNRTLEKASKAFTFFTLSALFILVVSMAFPVKAGLISLPDFSELAEKNGPVVVNISTTKKLQSDRRLPPHFQGMPDELLKYFFGLPGREGLPKDHGKKQRPQNEANSLGSGFILSEDGYILTNHHVIEGADDILVRMSNRTELKAKVIGTDPRTDVALIKVEAKGLPVAKIGKSSQIKVGQWVLAIGSPFGLDHTVSHGIISALGRALPDDTYVPFIQTDVPINPGNSGGPLINLEGEVIGINSQIYSRSGGSVGLSFSIPIDIAMNVVEQIKSNGKFERGFLGVQVQEVSSELAKSFGLDKPIGALVAESIKNTPAEAAGIQSGDIILEFNGQKINRSTDLPPVVGVSPVGKPLPVVVLRNGKKIKLTAKLRALEERTARSATSTLEDQSLEFGEVGVKISQLSQEELRELNLPFGVKVVDVAIDSPADRAGIRADDVLVSINFKPIKTAEHLDKVLKRLPKGQSMPVRIVRGTRSIFLPIVLK